VGENRLPIEVVLFNPVLGLEGTLEGRSAHDGMGTVLTLYEPAAPSEGTDVVTDLRLVSKKLCAGVAVDRGGDGYD